MFLHTGLQNYVVLEEIEAVNSNVYSAPTKRAVRAAEQQERLIDHTEGRKTRSVLFMKSGAIVLSTIESMTIVKRANAILTGVNNGNIAMDTDEVEEEDELEEEIPEPVAPVAKAKPAPVAAPAKPAAKTKPQTPAEQAAAKKAAAIAAKKAAAAAAIAEEDDDDGIMTDLPE